MLRERQCKPCEGGARPLDPLRIERYLEQVPGWRWSAGRRQISRHFDFNGFDRTMAFVNAVAWIAHRQGHHPDFRAGFDYCDVTLTTHAIDGLTENDFICAARINALTESVS
ncbi:MAG: 4a-hydroxytetrahydrobiopterin dehydratase [Xanthomonadales bacterium]|nr:4a-hydroxytetrahydrobiopterin dehydratase [Xanthomonadales bacterium]